MPDQVASVLARMKNKAKASGINYSLWDKGEIKHGYKESTLRSESIY